MALAVNRPDMILLVLEDVSHKWGQLIESLAVGHFSIVYLKAHIGIQSDIMLIPNCTSGKDGHILATYTRTEGVGFWADKPVLTHISLVHSPGPSVILCLHYE